MNGIEWVGVNSKILSPRAAKGFLTDKEKSVIPSIVEGYPNDHEILLRPVAAFRRFLHSLRSVGMTKKVSSRASPRDTQGADPLPTVQETVIPDPDRESRWAMFQSIRNCRLDINTVERLIKIRAMGRLTALSAWIPDRSPG